MSEFEKNYEKFEHNCQETFSKLNIDKMTSEEKIMAINAVTMLDMVLHCVLKRISEDEKKETNFEEISQNFIGPDGLSSDCIYVDDITVTPEKEEI